jgi:hypothetical protein
MFQLTEIPKFLVSAVICCALLSAFGVEYFKAKLAEQV